MNYLAALFLTAVLAVIILWTARLWARVVILSHGQEAFASFLEAEICSKCGGAYSKVQLRSQGILIARCDRCGGELNAEPCTCEDCRKRIVKSGTFVQPVMADTHTEPAQGTPASIE